MASAATSQASREKPQPAPAGEIQAEGIEETRWQPALGLPSELTIDLPLPNFKVADFLGLRAGSVISTEWRVSREVPLRVNGTLIGWGEFEGAANRLAVRVTELA